MPDLRTVLTETQRAEIRDAISAHRLWNGRCEACGAVSRRESDHMADVVIETLAGLPGVAVTQLPEQMTDRANVAEKIRDQPMWESDGSWAVIQDGDVEFETDHQNVYGTIPLSAAPGLVAVLLAALGGTR